PHALVQHLQIRHPPHAPRSPYTTLFRSSERRIGKHAVGNKPVARRALPTGQIVANNPKVVERHMRELRTASAFADRPDPRRTRLDRKSTRLNSSHVKISYAVFCLKKK